MNAILKVTALAAVLAAGAAFAQQTPPPASNTNADTSSMDYSKLDANGDGVISKDEAKGDANLSAQFSTLDTDHDGKLSSAELAKAKAKGSSGY
jgi:Ca2+-binding EF-hand superfamily protein